MFQSMLLAAGLFRLRKHLLDGRQVLLLLQHADVLSPLTCPSLESMKAGYVIESTQGLHRLALPGKTRHTGRGFDMSWRQAARHHVRAPLDELVPSRGHARTSHVV